MKTNYQTTMMLVSLALTNQEFAAAESSYQEHILSNDWIVRIDTSECAFNISKVVHGQEQAEVRVFSAAGDFLQIGHGTVDDTDPIMINGNVTRFPHTTTASSNLACADITADNDSVTLTGDVLLQQEHDCPVRGIFSLTFTAQDDHSLAFAANIPGAYGGKYGVSNYMALNFDSPEDEEIYGMGLQYSVWDFKGHSVPLISDEAGLGRGLQPITTIMDMQNGQGGTTTTSYAPAATFITNKQRGMVFDQETIGIANFEELDKISMVYWHEESISGTILWGQDPLALSQEVSKSVGVMEPLPEWVQQGAIVGIVNGQDFIEEQYNKMKQLELPMVGIWMQDWVGQHKFPEGTRLLWNWQLNTSWYTDWDGMVDGWAEDGCRPFIYINPYVADLSDVDEIRQHQYQIGEENGYFVKNADGDTYVINSISIKFAIIDLTNPEAWEWTKTLIKENLVKEGRAGGWMHDFGEYLPFDAVLADGSDPVKYHNKYTEDWAAVVKEALDEVEGGDEIVYFMRSGTGKSPKNTRLYWMGDQLVSWDANDGLQSAMIGLMNAGISGATIGHSDIGGYTSVATPLPDFQGITSFKRTQNLLHRWIEMSAFSDPVMRSHPSSAPDVNYQIFDSDESILFFKKFVDLHVKMADYKMKIMEEARDKGTPFTRSMMLHFHEDSRARADNSQFMLGENILMAPIFQHNADRRNVYLPGPATWKHLWTGKEYVVDANGQFLEDFSAPLGYPAVFMRDTENYKITDIFADEFSSFDVGNILELIQ